MNGLFRVRLLYELVIIMGAFLKKKTILNLLGFYNSSFPKIIVNMTTIIGTIGASLSH